MRHGGLMSYKLASIPGDGTGPEVVREGLKVLEAAASRTLRPSLTTSGPVPSPGMDANLQLINPPCLMFPVTTLISACPASSNQGALRQPPTPASVSYTHLRAHETDSYLVCRLLLEKKKKKTTK